MTRIIPILGLVLTLCGSLCWSAPSVTLVPSLPSPQKVGTVIGLTAIPKEEGNPLELQRILRYRFSISVNGSPFRVVRDFSPLLSFSWRPELYEHDARIQVTIKNIATKLTGQTEFPFRITPRATAGQPVVTPTANPLVALFSAPSCPAGSRFRVAFHRTGDAGKLFRTAGEPCAGTRTNNMYVAGMRADSTYELKAEVLTGDSIQAGPSVLFHTGLLDGSAPQAKVAISRDVKLSSPEPFLIQSVEVPNQRPTAMDLDGNVVWYFGIQDRSLVRMLPGGRFLVLGGGINEQNSRTQVLAEVDLVGNTIRDTNIERVADQLEERGIHSVCKPNGHECVPGFHHDAIRLENGHTIAIASLERMITKGAQGSTDPIDVVGTLIIDLDENLQVQWLWNSFDHLDMARKAKGDEKCRGPVGGAGCSAIFLAPEGNDWLHTNALSYVRSDGNLTLSLPEQDWVIKIDYQNGKGTGKVLWRLGDQGDFQIQSTDKLPWFSYQHDAAFEPPGSDTLLLLDNGPRRKPKDPKANTRGQLFKLDEKSRTATLVLNADLGVFSPFVGSAQRLSNGNYHFATGAILTDSFLSTRSIEVTPEGKVIYALESQGVLVYRSNRIFDLYTPPVR